MRINLILLLFLTLIITSCKNHVCPPEYYDWAFIDKNDPKQNEGAGSLYRYFFWIENDSIYVQSKSNLSCNILDKHGKVMRSCSFDTARNKSSLVDLESTPIMWRDKVIIQDSSKISDVSLVSFPIEKTSILSRRLPNREHGIKYSYEGKEHYFKFSMKSSGKCIYDIKQYDTTHFLVSIRGKIDDIKYGISQHYVIMLDFEKLSQRRFLGISL